MESLFFVMFLLAMGSGFAFAVYSGSLSFGAGVFSGLIAVCFSLAVPLFVIAEKIEEGNKKKA